MVRSLSFQVLITWEMSTMRERSTSRIIRTMTMLGLCLGNVAAVFLVVVFSIIRLSTSNCFFHLLNSFFFFFHPLFFLFSYFFFIVSLFHTSFLSSSSSSFSFSFSFYHDLPFVSVLFLLQHHLHLPILLQLLLRYSFPFKLIPNFYQTINTITKKKSLTPPPTNFRKK